MALQASLKVQRKDGKTFYVITSAEELAWFAEQVNGGASEINAVLANDIHFMDDTSKTSSVDWTTIGRITTVMFNGTFDGAGRTIYGLYLIGGGLFGVTGENAVIRNVSLVKAKMEMVEYGGGIVAINGGTVSGCTNRSSVFILPYQSRCYLGGIVGWNKGRVTGCMNDGDFFFGGMFYMSGVGDSLYGGGVVGRNEGTVDDCINRGLFGYDDKFAKFFHFGGIVGWNGGKVSKCINSGGGGFCSSSNGGYCSIKYENRFIGGGITSHNAGSVRDCLNFGSFSRKGNSGGLVGSADSSSNLFNSYSAADSATSGVGAEYGVTNCYYDSDILESASSIARLKLHTSDMQSDRFAWILNTTNGTAENSGVWSRDSEDYPIFADSLHKPIYKVIFDDSVETTTAC